MHNHWDKHLNLQTWLVATEPSVIVECGAGTGELTRHLLSLHGAFPFTLYVVNDKPLGFNGYEFRQGISYLALDGFEDASIDFCVIDTDHNYWTLARELAALHPKLKPKGFVALHDVATYYHDTGMALSYQDGSPYPKEAIEEAAPQYGGLGNALMDFLSTMRFDYRMVAFTSESHGAALIQKVALEGISIFVPGSQPAYAQSR